MLTLNTKQIHVFSSKKAEVIIIVWHEWVGGLLAASGPKDHQTELEYIKSACFHSWGKGFREGI